MNILDGSVGRRRWGDSEDGGAIRLGGGGFLSLRAICSTARCLRSITSTTSGMARVACSIVGFPTFKGRLQLGGVGPVGIGSRGHVTTTKTRRAVITRHLPLGLLASK